MSKVSARCRYGSLSRDCHSTVRRLVHSRVDSKFEEWIETSCVREDDAVYFASLRASPGSSAVVSEREELSSV